MGNISELNIESLIDSYQNLVFSICLRITGNYFDAQDLAQDTFLAAYRNLPSFDGKNGKAWIGRIATNKCIDFMRSRSRNQIPTEEEFFLAVVDSGGTPEGEYLKKAEKERILAICRQLKPPYDEIAEDYFFHELSMAQIAEKRNRNLKTVQTQVYRAKAMLKKLFTGGGGRSE